MKVAFKQKPKRKGVSLWVYITLTVITTVVLSFTTSVDKKYKTELTLTEWAKGSKWMDIAKQALKRSDLPSKDVTMIEDSLNAFQSAFILQINSQLEADKKLEKPPLKDTTQKKTN